MRVFSITRQWIQTYEHPFKSSLLSNVKIPPFPPNTQHKKQRIAVKQEERHVHCIFLLLSTPLSFLTYIILIDSSDVLYPSSSASVKCIFETFYMIVLQLSTVALVVSNIQKKLSSIFSFCKMI
jgi:hypothetical protein